VCLYAFNHTHIYLFIHIYIHYMHTRMLFGQQGTQLLEALGAWLKSSPLKSWKCFVVAMGLPNDYPHLINQRPINHLGQAQ
jgi:hypothetical protein